MIRKEMICRELETQLELGGGGLETEDHYLLEINLDNLDNSTGEDQTYWLLALKMAREAKRLQENLTNMTVAADNEE